MKKSQDPQKMTFLVLAFSGFIDYAGVAIVYPLFAYLLFEPSLNFLPFETSNSIRGLWLGILIALHPLLQFFVAPILGSLSDLRGRKKLLIQSFSLALFGYAFAILAILWESLALLAFFRICVGIAAGNCSVVSAIVADISSEEKKAKNYGLLNMAFGAGFTLGPFLSGSIAHQVALWAPFLLAFLLVALNIVLISWKLKETNDVNYPGKIPLFNSLIQLRQAVRLKELRFVFLSLLIFSFGWSFFTEFIPLYLLDRYHFTPAKIGLYYGYSGCFYAVSAGFLISPVLRWFKIERALFLSMLFSGAYLLLFATITNPKLLWLYLPLSQFFLALVYPTTCAVISNRVSQERQGEVMGIYQAIIAIALAMTPFFSGTFVGKYPILVVIVSSFFMILAAMTNLFLKRQTSVADMD